MTIALQLYSVRDHTVRDFLGTLERVAELGYEAVQLAGVFDTPAKTLKQVLNKTGLVVAGSHIPYHVLCGDELEHVIEYNKEVENTLLVCPYLEEHLRRTADDYKRVAESLNRIGERCLAAGLTLAYHNHGFEFELFDGRTGFDILFDETESHLVKMELDCYWVSYAGLDPRSILDQYQGRCVSLHLKDLKRDHHGEAVSTEIGNGQLDMPAVIKAGLQHGVKWLVIEQEHFERDSLESARINLQHVSNLIEMGAK